MTSAITATKARGQRHELRRRERRAQRLEPGEQRFESHGQSGPGEVSQASYTGIRMISW